MSRKKLYKESGATSTGRVALGLFRTQPIHIGHADLISRMLLDSDTVIIGFGSTQLSGVVRHPFTFEQRLDMMKTLFGDRFKPVQFVDIDAATSSLEWADYVLEKIKKLNLPEPTDYYTGSPQDAKWYTSHFASMDDDVDQVGQMKTYYSKHTNKRLHILDRVASQLPAAEEIRSLIERRDDEWKRYVPLRLADYIEKNYPGKLRMPIIDFQYPKEVNVGTRFINKADKERKIQILDHNGEWTFEAPVKKVNI